MIFSLAARVYLMTVDHMVDRSEAIWWVTRRLPANFQSYYRQRIQRELTQL